MKRARIRVAGLVQGVNFRSTVRAYALENGIKGTIRNLPDGSVRIEAGTDELTLSQLVTWLRESPGFAKVSDVVVEGRQEIEDLPPFHIIP